MFAKPEQENTYAIHTLYLDNAAQELCRATLTGERNRFKLRIRFYDHDPQSPVFCEIKRLVNDAVAKERVAVHHVAVPQLVSSFVPDWAALWQVDPSSWSTLQRFCELAANYQANRGLFVSYQREAYVSPHDETVRVTLDREVSAGHYDQAL